MASGTVLRSAPVPAVFLRMTLEPIVPATSIPITKPTKANVRSPPVDRTDARYVFWRRPNFADRKARMPNTVTRAKVGTRAAKRAKALSAGFKRELKENATYRIRNRMQTNVGAMYAQRFSRHAMTAKTKGTDGQ